LKFFVDNNYNVNEIAVADGEITVLPHRDEVLNLITKNKWYATICTNGIIFNQKVFDILKVKGSFLDVSLDSGTTDTYLKVKQVDAFDTVCRNIKKYAQSGCPVILKYILMDGMNDNYNDIDGFLNFVKSVDNSQIVLSMNWHEIDDNKESDISEDRYIMYKYMVDFALLHNIYISFDINGFSQYDIKRMEKICSRVISIG
jgi:molybdenum cofactor biosynthesis enzyme MoaA